MLIWKISDRIELYVKLISPILFCKNDIKIFVFQWIYYSFLSILWVNLPRHGWCPQISVSELSPLICEQSLNSYNVEPIFECKLQSNVGPTMLQVIGDHKDIYNGINNNQVSQSNKLQNKYSFSYMLYYNIKCSELNNWSQNHKKALHMLKLLRYVIICKGNFEAFCSWWK